MVIYNSLAAHAPQFVSAQGSHLWLAGNSAYATGLYQLPCGPGLQAWDPRLWALQARKLVLFFSDTEFGNNTYVGLFRAYLWLPPLGFGVPGILGLLGLLLGVPVAKRRWLAVLLVLGSYAAGIVAFVIVGRYRLPAAALLCLPSASLLLAVRSLRPRRVVLALAGVAALTFAANTALPPDVSVPFAHANAATVFASAGQASTADAELEQAHTARLAVEAQDPNGCSQLPLL
jgi:hypothetical protein